MPLSDLNIAVLPGDGIGIEVTDAGLEVLDRIAARFGLAFRWNRLPGGALHYRDTGTAREGVKFDYEVLESGPVFIFRMQVENVTDTDRTLLNLVLNLLRQGLHVGGKQAAGLGRIRLESWAVKGFENAQALWESIIKGEDPNKSLTWKGSTSC